jgi:hypothetical protein
MNELSEMSPCDIAKICVICVNSRNAANMSARIKEKVEISKKILILLMWHIKIVIAPMAKMFAFRNSTPLTRPEP